MAANMVQDRIQDVFREVFRNERLEITESMSKADIAGWDSLADVNLIISLEEEFGIKFTTHEIGQIHRVVDVLNALAQRGIAAR